MSTSTKERAEKWLDDEVECWMPDPGGVVAGVVTDIDVRNTQHSANVPVVTLETDTGQHIEVWAFWTVLRGELQKHAPEIGSRLAVRRLDDSERGYRRYRVFTERTERTFDWGSVQAEASDSELMEKFHENPARKELPVGEPDDPLPF